METYDQLTTNKIGSKCLFPLKLGIFLGHFEAHKLKTFAKNCHGRRCSVIAIKPGLDFL